MTSKFVVADYMETLMGARAAKSITVLILWTAFASIFSVMLGYSRVLFAAARDGNFFSIFAKLHPTQAYPFVSVIFLGVVASIFCWLPLRTVVVGIVSIRSIIPFMSQIVGALILRRKQPDRRRPFKMWLYPLPAIVALGLWAKVAISPEKGLRIGALYVIAAGGVFFLIRDALVWGSKPLPANPEN
jgi:amino acid transporter